LNQKHNFTEKIVYDLTKFTHLDFPDRLACIVWLVGCSLRCGYCYNKSIVFSKDGQISLNDILSFLQKRVGKLEGVVLSGGEATDHELIPFCKEVKKLGFLIKLDTNGTNFKQIKQLINLNLLDYIALDYKAPKYKFKAITHSNKFEYFSKTLNFLISSDIDFEVRTTLHADLLNEEDINFIIDDLKKRGYQKEYFIQNFLETEQNIGNLKASNREFEKSKIIDDLKVVWRNY
jgi:pyruvate formate lyase activating enzyme